MIRGAVFCGLTMGAVCAAPLAAQVEVRDCTGFEANAQNVDWSDPTVTFANGAIRFISLNVGEPACCGGYVMVLYPTPDEPFPMCAVVGPEMGWLGASLSRAVSRYDPATGLTVDIPVMVSDGLSESTTGTVTVHINQATGELTAR